MRTALLHHPDSALHRMQAHHPECPQRLDAVLARLAESGLAEDLTRVLDADAVTAEDVQRVHPAPYATRLAAMAPAEGLAIIDDDTYIGPGTLTAAARAAGIATRALDDLMAGHYARAFCAVRPPGHHAETATPMGFCFYNSIAIAARRALDVHGLERVAILDFDVHHGNGTAEIFRDDPRVLFASSFEHPQYPNRMLDLPGEHLVFTPLAAGTGGAAFRRAIERDWLPALERHRPQLVLVSAGFDAHARDPLASLQLEVDDYRWITELICSAAADHADGRVLSMLEGGYDLAALAASAEAHVRVLLEA
ncbi:MAG TPA: histone deacetylase family protein [Pseudomonadales bacterium]|nr:histone deacetylase family protein [Pseudomonadales bacterium]